MKKNEDKKAQSTLDWSTLLGSALGTLGASYMMNEGRKLVEEEMDKHRVRADELAIGDIIEVNHLRIKVVGVRLSIKADFEGNLLFGVQVAGAPVKDVGIDWKWSRNDVLWNSPFLDFKPDDKLWLVERGNQQPTLEFFAEQNEGLQLKDYKKGVDIGERVGKEKGYELCFADVRKVLAHRLDQHPAKDGDDPHDIGFDRGIDFVFSTLLGSREEFFKLLDMINKEARGTEDAPAPPPQEDRPSKQGGSSQLFREKLD